ncbi:cystathionine beta-lyase [Kushneria sinocarnis]|uniref:cysteine-S-conjugate beta-lyase n=1 Tax=Kushneria sinocarnis TaxID=595502 RepID=A0A420WXU8_9GAMM|nr:PatB family C-S lyase [Kushneria sinocarnis]RKR04540.1 cystathionine beta-lyase [Kushneria sinocarnis]
MSFDFTTPLDRRRFATTKWQRYDEDVLPLWVADMDFAVAPAIRSALAARLEHPVFGYTQPSDALREVLCQWSASHYDWPIEPHWQHWLPGVVPALHVAALTLTEPGDGVLTVTPIYPPFLKVGDNTGRTTQTAPMQPPGETSPHWTLDFAAMEAAVTPETRLLLWCHPHNPTGRNFTVEELEQLAEFVERHDLLVCSDELHCDLILDADTPHRPLGRVVPRLAPRLITLWAPSKTFNVAGLTSACAIISDDRLRARFRRGCLGLMPSDNVMGETAAEAAFRDGEPWRQALLAQLRDNRALLESFVARWPGVVMAPPEATYLAWLDLRRAGLGESPQRTLLEQARVALSDGADFGWPGFARLNFGTEYSRLSRALERMDELLKAG